MKQELEQLIAACVQQLYGISLAVELTRPEEQFGDYATNAALQLGRQVNKSAREVAEELATALRAQAPSTVGGVTIAGPGFINLVLSDAALIDATKNTPQQQFAGKSILAEYSDPNPFKPLHAGHLYTTLVGDVIARLLQIGGASVTRINYGGDVGLHVGKSMWAIVRALGGEFPEKLNTIPEAERSQWLGDRYVEGNIAYIDDDAAKQEIVAINKRVYELHQTKDHDSAFAKVYWLCRQWSYDYFPVLYQQLQVTAFDRIIPESEIVPLGLATIQKQLAAGVYELSDGAVVFKGEKSGLHTRVFINSAGLPTYEAKDVGLLLTKWNDYHFDRSIVITANEQVDYMRVMLASVAEFEPEAAKRSEHLTHGIVKLQGGTKMSSRDGTIVLALDIIASARQANVAITGQDNPDTVLGAIKYAFLKSRIGGDIVYDPAESVSLEGNSGPYLQYAHARAQSILRKATTVLDGANAVHAAPAGQEEHFAGSYTDVGEGERPLVRKLGEYAETVDAAVQTLMPHLICTYLYELAQTFNRFYEHNRVLGDAREAQRLQLVHQYATILRAGLELLGIPAPHTLEKRKGA